MSVKSAKVVTSEIVGTPAQAVPTQVQPKAITLIGNSMAIMQQCAVLIRAGYYPQPDTVVEFFGHSGTMQIVLVPGTPAQHFIDAAATSTAEAAEREHAVYLRDVEQAAARMIEAAKRAETQAQIDSLVAKQKEELRALEATVAEAAAGQAAAVAELAAKLK